MIECTEVKKYLDEIGIPYIVKDANDMEVLQLQYNQDL